ncbi:MAG: SEC-C metal-binding domain-containing protein, partial [Thermoleophilaceae bacterium]
EGHAMFEELTATIQEEVVRYLLRLQIEKTPEQGELEGASASNGGDLTYEHESAAGSEAIRAAGANEAALERARAGSRATATAGAGGAAATTVSTTGQRIVAEEDRVGRNDPCPCGSGKKYKKCHGA